MKLGDEVKAKLDIHISKNVFVPKGTVGEVIDNRMANNYSNVIVVQFSKNRQFCEVPVHKSEIEKIF